VKPPTTVLETMIAITKTVKAIGNALAILNVARILLSSSSLEVKKVRITTI